MGVPTNLGWFTLFGSEILGPVSTYRTGSFTTVKLIFLIILWVSHVGVISLFFLVKTKYFKQLLIWEPLLFITAFICYSFLNVFLLIPFILCWVIALVRVNYMASN